MQGTFNLLKGVIPFTKYPYVGVSDPCAVCGGAEKATVCEYDRRIKRLTTVICDDCGKATHIDDERVTGALREAGKDAGFTDVRPVVELRGLCSECAG